MITLAQIFVLTLYLALVSRKFGVLESISHSSYSFKGDQRYYFTAMCWLLGALNLAQGMEGWGVLTSVMLGFTGITVKWMEPGSSAFWVHSIGAFGAVLSGFIGVLVLHGIWIPFALFIPIAIATYFTVRNYIWWIEIQAFALILISYMLR